VEKYNPPVPAELAGEVKGAFPGFLVKTDETRIQAVENVQVEDQLLNGVLHRHRGRRVFATEKLDGTSVTMYLYEGEFGVCSRNLDLVETSKNTLWKVARELDVEARIQSTGRNLALQGELIGPNIQRNRYKLDEHKVAFFNVFDIDKHTFLGRPEFEAALHKFDLESVPLVDEFDLDHTVEELVEMSEAPSVLNAKQTREGIVVRSVEESRDEELGRLSFKVISPKFLLKGGD
ncbi:MAG: RNA ligase family protein, partial [Verrucomicrobiota bacterium]